MDDLIGRSLRGYEVCELLGTGGFGAVYRAFQPALEREVAVKVIKAELADEPAFVARFEREAQIIARLEHPHIVPLYDYWREPGGAYLVMRLMRGGNLHQLVRERQPGPAEILRLLRQVGDALDSAHRKGVVHRDVKPHNVMLDEEGRAYLADFGLAVDERQDAPDGQDLLYGSPFYMSPEAVVGGAAAPAADLYSLGVMVYELLTGTVPFGDSPAAVVAIRHVREVLPDVCILRPDLAPAVNAVVQKATARRSVERYPSAREMVEALAAALEAPAEALALPATLANPYKGLRAFQEEDAADFFGREALTRQILARLAQDAGSQSWVPFLALVGPSGSGKSSVARAGLVPALRAGALPGAQRWPVADMFPGPDPLAELERALLRVSIRPLPDLPAMLRSGEDGLARALELALPSEPESGLVLLVDQFEEVFTLAPEADRDLFLDNLWRAMAAPGRRCLVLATLRADFYDRPLFYPEWGRLFRDQAQVVLPLSPEELRAAVVQPAHNAGLQFEPGLPAAILADVHNEPGALPLLQYALTELVERREGQMLTLAAYRAMDGVAGALARRADDLYAMLSPSGQDAVRQILVRLVTLGEGTEDTRRRVPSRELVPAGASPAQRDELEDALGIFVRYRLLTADHDPQDRSPTVEVAHEALIRLWRRLRGWLDASRDELRLQRRLTVAAADWLASGRDASFMATGVRLAQWEALAAGRELALNREEQEYVQASVAARLAQENIERERQERELETARRLAETEKRRAEEQAATAARLRRRAVALAGVLVLALIAALAAALFARTARLAANDNAIIAATAQAASTRAVAEAESRATQQALAQEHLAHAESLRLAAEANGLLQRGESAELAALLAMRGLRAQYTGEADAALQRAIRLPFGQLLLPHPQPIYKVAISPDGRTILSGATDGIVRLWETGSGRLVREMQGHTNIVETVLFSPDGRYGLSASDDTTVRLWDLASGTQAALLEGHTDLVNNLAISPDGRTAASSGDDATVRLWALPSGQPLATWDVPATASALQFTPDGESLVVGMYTGECEVWDVATGEVERSLDGHTDSVWSIAFAPDGRMLLTAGGDNVARLWQWPGGRLVRGLPHGEAVFQAVWAPDGQTAFTGSLDGSARLWDVATGRELRRLMAHTSSLYSVAMAPDGHTLLTGSTDGTARLWDLRNPAELDSLAAHSLPVYALSFSHDGHTLASGSNDGTVRLWDAASRQLRRSLTPGQGLYSLAFSPDDRLLVAGTYDRVFVWDLETGKVRHSLAPEQVGYWVAFAPDGRTFLAAQSDYAIHVYDSASGEELRTFAPDTYVAMGAFSPDGRLLLTAGDEDTVRLWDVASGQQIRTFEQQGAALAVAISPDGGQALTGGRDGVARVWDMETGEMQRELLGHTNAIWTIAFSPDGKLALTASQDKTARLWDLATGKPVRLFPGHANAAVGAAVVTPDGSQVAIASFDGTLNLTPTGLPALLQTACDRTLRDLTAGERAAYNITGTAPTCSP